METISLITFSHFVDLVLFQLGSLFMIYPLAYLLTPKLGDKSSRPSQWYHVLGLLLASSLSVLTMLMLCDIHQSIKYLPFEYSETNPINYYTIQVSWAFVLVGIIELKLVGWSFNKVKGLRGGSK